MNRFRMCDVENPYKEKCLYPREECGRINARVCEFCRMWGEAFNAGLEAAAEVCDAEIAEVKRVCTDPCFITCSVGTLAQAAQKIRAMKGGQG